MNTIRYRRRTASTTWCASEAGTAASYADVRWHVVFQRTLRPSVELSGQVGFAPSHALGIAIAIWGGSNRERAGQKSISGEWESLEVAA